MQTLVTNKGMELLSSASVTGSKVTFKYYTLGFGGDVTADMDKLEGQFHKSEINSLTIDGDTINVGVMIDKDKGKYNQIGILDDKNNLIIVSDHPTTELDGGIVTTFDIKIKSSNAEVVEITTGNDNVFATRDYVTEVNKTLTNNINDIGGELDKLDDKLITSTQALQQEDERLKKLINDNKNKTNENTHAINSLKGDVATNKSDISKLSSEQNKTNQRVEEVATDVQNAKNSLTDLTGRLHTTNEKVGQNKGCITNLTKDNLELWENQTKHSKLTADGETLGHVYLTDDISNLDVTSHTAVTPAALQKVIDQLPGELPEMPEEYVLPPATETTLGGVTIGDGLTVDEGHITVNTATNEDVDNVATDVYITPETLEYRFRDIEQTRNEVEGGTAFGVENIVEQSTSVALGEGNKLEKPRSTALGFKNTTFGKNNHAIGRNNNTFGEDSYAIGHSNTTVADGSVTIGGLNNTGGEDSVAIGRSNKTEGVNTLSIGYRNTSKGDNSITLGENNTAYSDGSFASGVNSSTLGLRSIAIGEGNKTSIMARDSVAIGSYSETDAPRSVAFGLYAEAKGADSIAAGTRAYTEGSHAVSAGNKTKAIGDYSLAVGEDNEARGNHGVARGENVIVTGKHASGSGKNINTQADHSHTVGEGLTTKTRYTHLIGRYNEIKGTVINAMPTEDSDVWAIGNGADASERNTVARIQHDGQMFIDGRYRNKGADYAEYFEWSDGNPHGEDRTGLAVTIAGDGKIKLANKGDEVIGVVSATPSVVGNDPDKWQGKYITDDFGRTVWTTEDGVHKPKLNPEYDDEQEYIPRGKRKEWSAIGLLGQIRVVDDGTCEVGKRAGISSDGVFTAGDNYIVLDRVSKNIVTLLIR